LSPESAAVTFVSFTFGTIVGSFLNVCIFRVPEGESVVFPGSHCRACRKAIAWYDNVPVLSWLVLGGRCRHCRARISAQYWVVELLTGGLFAACYRVFGLTPEGFIYLGLALALVVESFIDLRHQIIPDGITLPGIAVGLAVSALWPPLHGRENWTGALAASFIGVLAGGGLLWIIGSLGEKIFKREAMGGGDVKLLAMIGAFLGWEGVLWTVFAASVLGTVFGLYQRLRRGAEEIPFGPYLGLAAFVYPFFGRSVVEWYFGHLAGRH